MKKTLLFLCLSTLLFSSGKNITPSEVFTEVKKIDAEMHLLKKYFKIKKGHVHISVNGDVKPRNVWQLLYSLSVKVNTLRVKHGLPRVEEVALAPVKRIDPFLPYGMTQRILTETRIIKKYLGIEKKIRFNEKYSGKKPIDVFNELLGLSKELDILNKKAIDPSSVFAQVMRLFWDLDIIYAKLDIKDETIPPKKVYNSKPKDAVEKVFEILKSIHKIQRRLDIERVDFTFLKPTTREIVPEDTFILVAMALSELQVIKAHLGITNETTPPAILYSEKTPSDVEQLLGWINKRLIVLQQQEEF